MSYGFLLLRVVIGGVILAHGLQKTFGWWNGPGPKGLRGWLESMGFREAGLMTLMLIVAEDSGLFCDERRPLVSLVPFARLAHVVLRRLCEEGILPFSRSKKSRRRNTDI